MDKLKLLGIFTRVTDLGGFSQAATSLGLTPSSVSKAIGRLEIDLGVTLFDRNTRFIKLTEPGEYYYRFADKLIKELSECEAELVGMNQRTQGSLKINVPTAFGRLYVTPFLSQFHTRFPELSLDVLYTDEHINMIEHGIDVTIRTGQVNDSNLIVRQLSPMDFIICGAPSFFSRHGLPKNQQALMDLPWILFRFTDNGRTMPISISDDLQIKPVKNVGFSVSDGESMVALCRSGHGLIQAPHFLLRDSLEQGELQLLFPPLRITKFGVFALYQRQVKTSDKIRHFVDCLRQFLNDRNESTYQTWAQSLIPLMHQLPD